MFVDAFICTLFFNLSNILSPVTLHTDGQVDGVSCLTPHLVSYLILAIACTIHEFRSCDHAFTAFGVWAALAAISAKTRNRFLVFLCSVDFQMFPSAIYD